MRIAVLCAALVVSLRLLALRDSGLVPLRRLLPLCPLYCLCLCGLCGSGLGRRGCFDVLGASAFTWHTSLSCPCTLRKRGGPLAMKPLGSEITEFIRMFVARHGQLLYWCEPTGKDYIIVTGEEVRLSHIDRVWSRWSRTEEVHALSHRHPLNDGINYAQLV